MLNQGDTSGWVMSSFTLLLAATLFLLLFYSLKPGPIQVILLVYVLVITTVLLISKDPRLFLFITSLGGSLMMAYLLRGYFTGDMDVCGIASGFSCSYVNQSKYAVFFGIPISVFGLGYFLFALWVSIISYSQRTLQILGLMTIFALGPSVYFSFIEYVVLNEICLFCEGAKFLMILHLMTCGFFGELLRVRRLYWILIISGTFLITTFIYLLQ